MSSKQFTSTKTVLILGGITALTATSIDIVLPATGVIARDFMVADAQGALLIGAYFLAFAIGQLFWGLFSDAYGRRLALILSLSGFTVTSLACALAPTFESLIVFRALQGLMGGAPIVGRAMVRDVAEGNEAARIIAVLSAVLTIATLVAPILGSIFLVFSTWHMIFYALALLGLGYLAFTMKSLPETIVARRPERFTLGFILPNGAKLLSQRAIVVPILQGGMIFAGYASVLSIGAILTETVYGVAPELFGALFAFAALSNTAGALLVRRLLRDIDLIKVNRVALAATLIAACAALVLIPITPSLTLLWTVVCLYVFAFGMIVPTATAMAMDPAGDMPGFAAALTAGAQIGLGAAGAALSAFLFDGSHRTIPELMAVCGLLTVIVSLFYRPAAQPS